jgi:CzcA family heavy metal efflux pump
VLAAAAVLCVGIMRLRGMPVDVLPEFAPPYVEIQAEALGLSATEVEELITIPMEAILLNGVAWVDTMRSESMPGLSSIVLTFQAGTDLLRARQMVQERLTKAHALPHVSKPPTMLQPLAATGRAMQIGLTSKTLSLTEMSVLARWTIRPRLMGVHGVANVAIWGQRDRQLQVQVDPERLQAAGVTLLQVIKTAGNALWVSPLTFLTASTPGSGGWIDTPNQRLGVRHLLPIRTPNDLAQVIVEGTTIPLGDVAEVVEDHQPLIGDALINDSPGLVLVVERFPWATTLDVTRGVEAALTALKPGLTGLEFVSSLYRPATFIERAFTNLTTVLLIGGVLVLLGLGALLYEWRRVLISGVAILLSLVTAGLVLVLGGGRVDVMIVAGLVMALGAVVDDALIDIENMVRRLRQPRQEGRDLSTVSLIREAALEMRSAAVYATLIMGLALVPVFVMGGVADAFFRPLALAYGLALLASLMVALTVTPVLALLLVPTGPLERRESPLVRWFQRRHEAVLAQIIRRPRQVSIAVGVLVLVGLAGWSQLGESWLPAFKETDLLVRWDSTPGTSRQEMLRLTTQVSHELRAIPGVRDVSVLVGRAVTSDRVANVNASELWINVDPAADYATTVAHIQRVVDGYPNLSRTVLTYLNERVRKVLMGARDDLVVRLAGPQMAVLTQKVAEVQQILAQINGIDGVRVEQQMHEPTLEVEVNLAAAEPHGIKPGDVRRAAATLLAGIEVGSLFEDQKVFDVVVTGVPTTRHSLTSIRELLIDTPSGGHVRLEEVATVRTVPALSVIKREGISRFVDVGVTVRGRDLGSVADDIQRRLQKVAFPLEYHAEVLGEYAERTVSQKRLLAFAVAAVIGIFLLLQAAFGSWRLATLTVVLLPMALVGGVLAVWAGGGIMSLGAQVGFVTVFGLAVRHSLVLIRHYQHLEEQEGEPWAPELVLRGTRERLAPIVMTAITTGLALVPLVLAGDMPGLEIVHPIAVVILGGLVTSTLLTLFVVPVLYWRFGVGTRPEPRLVTGVHARNLTH